MRPFDEALSRLEAVPGLGRRTAEELVAEIGMQMARFPTAAHLGSWAETGRGNDESAGRRKTAGTGKGSPCLPSSVVEAAHAAARTKETYLSAQYRRLATRRGKRKAAAAVGHSILVISATTCASEELPMLTWDPPTLTNTTGRQWNGGSSTGSTDLATKSPSSRYQPPNWSILLEHPNTPATRHCAAAQGNLGSPDAPLRSFWRIGK